MTIIYHYSQATGEYLAKSECRLDPREGKPLVPAYATLDPPPMAGINEVAVNDGDRWSVQKDYRNETWYLSDGAPVPFETIGDEPTVEMVKAIPVDAEMANAKEAKLAEIRSACESYALAGFDSSALGTPHHYPSGDRDQQNLNGLITKTLIESVAGWTALFWCQDAAGVWDRRPHDYLQIRAVGTDGANHIIGAQNKLKTLTDNLSAATTLKDIALIVW